MLVVILSVSGGREWFFLIKLKDKEYGMMTKTTTRYAERRNCFVEISEINKKSVLWIGMAGECEPDVSYIANTDGTFTFKNADNKIIDDMPGTIWDEKHLRQVIEYVSENLM